jgi:hypothetical protein
VLRSIGKQGCWLQIAGDFLLVYKQIDGKEDCCCAGYSPDGHGVFGCLWHGATVGRRHLDAGQGWRLGRRSRSVSPANVPAAAGGWTVMRHQQLAW